MGSLSLSESLVCLATLQHRDRARRVFTDQAGIRLGQARNTVTRWASRMKGELHPGTKNRL